MIESIELKNFRCFESLELTGLKKMNIITGANASGKSALLEALLAGGRATPEGFLAINGLRGIFPSGQPQSIPLIGILPQQFHAMWEHLFFSKSEIVEVDNKKTVKTTIANNFYIKYADSDAQTYLCEVTFGTPVPSVPAVPSGGIGVIVPQGLRGALSGAAVPLFISRSVTPKSGPTQRTASTISLGPQGQLQGTAILPNLGPIVLIFSSVINYAEVDNVAWLSDIRATGDVSNIVDFVISQFPFVSDLEVWAPGGLAGIFATLKSGDFRRLQLVSAGLYKIITILLACANARKGVILIDEIENGIFYQKYQSMWSILYQFAQIFDCQIFATSHSAECLQALPDVIGDNEKDFCLLYAERLNGTCAIYQSGGVARRLLLQEKMKYVEGMGVGAHVTNPQTFAAL